ncbi:hypothetical protein [Egbenema bharatensis]|uniref:hypothetical protein n=1 Tax=Egbenema bharatensis TaxID=3463334 RepID=UPI003A8A1DF3
MNTKPSTSKPFLSVQTIVLASVAWAVISLMFFLLFSISPIQGERPHWYIVITYILEQVPFLVAGLLCFRNWRSSQIVSGRTVWLAFGLGMMSYFIANLFLAYWELGLGLTPDVSPGDLFFILTYVFLGWGMVQAVMSKQLSLTKIQWVILAGIAVGGVVIALIFVPGPEEVSLDAVLPGIESAEVAPNVAESPDPIAAAPELEAVPEISPVPPTEPAASDVPAWAEAVDERLAPLANLVTWLYIIGDVILVVMATTLLLAFWGGRFSLSWRFIAAAVFCYYIADIWFNYAINYIPDYQTGALPEVFWIFSGCLFAIGAALEYHLSNVRRRASRRRA